MSKIGNYNLELQEQANELGFSTVQEALDAGYEVIERSMGGAHDLDDADNEPDVWYELQKMDEQTKAHHVWIAERDEVRLELMSLRQALSEQGSEFIDANEANIHQVLTKAIKFIEKGEV